jgi:hypothetical protein
MPASRPAPLASRGGRRGAALARRDFRDEQHCLRREARFAQRLFELRRCVLVRVERLFREGDDEVKAARAERATAAPAVAAARSREVRGRDEELVDRRAHGIARAEAALELDARGQREAEGSEVRARAAARRARRVRLGAERRKARARRVYLRFAVELARERDRRVELRRFRRFRRRDGRALRRRRALALRRLLLALARRVFRRRALVLAVKEW